MIIKPTNLIVRASFSSVKMHTCSACIHVEARSRCEVPPTIALYLFVTGFLSEPDAHWWARLADQVAPGSRLFLHAQNRLEPSTTKLVFLWIWVSGIQTGLHTVQHFDQLKYLPSPLYNNGFCYASKTWDNVMMLHTHRSRVPEKQKK